MCCLSANATLDGTDIEAKAGWSDSSSQEIPDSYFYHRRRLRSNVQVTASAFDDPSDLAHGVWTDDYALVVAGNTGSPTLVGCVGDCDGSGGSDVVAANVPLEQGWHHVAVGREGSTTTLYVDGQAVAASGATPSLTGTLTGDLSIGDVVGHEEGGGGAAG